MHLITVLLKFFLQSEVEPKRLQIVLKMLEFNQYIEEMNLKCVEKYDNVFDEVSECRVNFDLNNLLFDKIAPYNVVVYNQVIKEE